jgi:hypothetical protein
VGDTGREGGEGALETVGAGATWALAGGLVVAGAAAEPSAAGVRPGQRSVATTSTAPTTITPASRADGQSRREAAWRISGRAGKACPHRGHRVATLSAWCPHSGHSMDDMVLQYPTDAGRTARKGSPPIDGRIAWQKR